MLSQALSLCPWVVRIARVHGTSPYALLWRTVEVAVLADLAARHGLDVRDRIDLDVGCGNGILGSAIARQIDLGFDLSLPTVRWAWHNMPAYRSLVCASATAMPLAGSSCRLVFSNSVIEHIPDGEAALDELARVVAPGGYLLFSTVSDRFPQMVLGEQAPREMRVALDHSYAHRRYYSLAGLCDALRARGLTVLDHATYITARQARLMHRLRSWESRHPRSGLPRRLGQLGRLPVSAALLPMLLPLFASTGQGAGIAVIARR